MGGMILGNFHVHCCFVLVCTLFALQLLKFTMGLGIIVAYTQVYAYIGPDSCILNACGVDLYDWYLFVCMYEGTVITSQYQAVGQPSG